MKADTDFQQAKKFLSLLFQPDDYVTICNQFPGQKGVYGKSFHTQTYPAVLERLSQYVNQGRQVYFGVLPRTQCLPDGEKGGEEQTAPGRVTWVDIDFKDNPYKNEQEILRVLQNYSFPPSIIIHSGNGYHAYWLLEKRYDPQEIKQRNKGIQEALTPALKVDSVHNAIAFYGYLEAQTLKISKTLSLV